MLLLSVLLSLLVSAPGLSSAAAPSPTSNGGSSTINAAPSSASWACPPPGFESVRGFSLQDYIARPWFVQQQSPNSYQRENQLFCVRAEYRLASNTSDRRLKVFNQVRAADPPESCSQLPPRRHRRAAFGHWLCIRNVTLPNTTPPGSSGERYRQPRQHRQQRLPPAGCRRSEQGPRPARRRARRASG